jgi:rubrerythrin
MDRLEIYRFIITAEVRSQNLYSALAKSFRNPETSALFHELVLLEKNHEEKVRNACATEFPGMQIEVTGSLSMELRKMDFTDPQVILEYAIGREDVAHRHYMNLAEQTRDLSLKEMLLRFAAEEEEHKHLLQTETERIQGILQWFDPSELNGLMED